MGHSWQEVSLKDAHKQSGTLPISRSTSLKKVETTALRSANADGGGGARLLVDQPINVGREGASIFDPVTRWSPDGALIAYRTGGLRSR